MTSLKQTFPGEFKLPESIFLLVGQFILNKILEAIDFKYLFSF